jgi:hypothetical protein
MEPSMARDDKVANKKKYALGAQERTALVGDGCTRYGCGQREFSVLFHASSDARKGAQCESIAGLKDDDSPDTHSTRPIDPIFQIPSKSHILVQIGFDVTCMMHRRATI